jgi:hypothetical protein
MAWHAWMNRIGIGIEIGMGMGNGEWDLELFYRPTVSANFASASSFRVALICVPSSILYVHTYKELSCVTS